MDVLIVVRNRMILVKSFTVVVVVYCEMERIDMFGRFSENFGMNG